MINNIIVILLFIGKGFSSLTCRGSISIENDMMLIDLYVTKFDIDDDLDKFMEKSQAANVKPRIYLQIDSGKKTIEINSETDHKPNYVGINFNEVTALKNVTKANTVNNSINAREPVLKEQIYNISNTLQRVTSLMLQQLGNNNDKKLHQNTISNQDLRHHIIPRRSRKFTHINNKKMNSFASASEFFNDKFAFEKKRLNSELKIFFEYAKSIQKSLLWLIRLLELKWQQSRNNFDDILRLSLFSLQKQAEFLLETLIEDNGRQRKESKKYQYFPTDRSESNVETIKREKVIILQKKKNRKRNKKTNIKRITDNQAVLITESSILVFPKSSKNENKILNATEIKTEATTLRNYYNNKPDEITSENKETKGSFEGIRKKTQKINEDKTSDQSAYKPETRILNYPILLKNTNMRTLHGKSIEMENRKNLFGQLKNSSIILSNRSMTDTLEETDTQKRVRMEALHKSLKENTTNVPDTEVLMSSNKSKNQHVSQKEMAGNYHNSHENVETNVDRTAIDELLEAVNEVLPTEKSVEILPMRLKMISGIS